MDTRALMVLAALAVALAQGGGFMHQARAAELAKEGTFSIRAAWSGAWQGFDLDEERWVSTFELKGVVTNDAGQGFLHSASMRCIGLGRTVKGTTEHGGNCVYTDADGDELFTEWQDHGTAGVGAKGSGPVIGGTGKFAGIGGAVAYERIEVRPAAEGTFQGYTVSFTGNWKLP
jgi:hypothetical protein